MKETGKNGAMGMIIPIAVGVCVSVAVCMVLMIVFAAVLSKSNFSETTVLVMSMIAQGVGALCGGFAGARLFGQSGMIIGAASGAVVFLLFTAAALIFGSGGMTIVTVIKLVLMLLCSVLGGICGVNLRKKTKVI